MLSQTAEYALRAVLHLAQRELESGGEGRATGRAGTPTERVCVDDVAEALGIPRNYLSKTMNVLRGAGILRSSRGPGGGFGLAVPSAELTVARVVESFDPAEHRSGCLLRSGPCDEERPCAAHHRWREVERVVRTFFARTTIADLIEGDGGAASAADPLAGPAAEAAGVTASPDRTPTDRTRGPDPTTLLTDTPPSLEETSP